MSAKHATRLTVSTTCECTYCPACGLGYAGAEECEECGNATLISDECMDCQPWESLKYEVDSWCKGIRAKEVFMEGRNMNWNHLNGFTHVRPFYEHIRDNLTINGDFTLEFSIQAGKPLRITRTSHDEPTGAKFIVYRTKSKPKGAQE